MIVHIVRGGHALCPQGGMPRSWPEGDRWVAYNDAPEDLARATCLGCRRVAGLDDTPPGPTAVIVHIGEHGAALCGLDGWPQGHKWVPYSHALAESLGMAIAAGYNCDACRVVVGQRLAAAAAVMGSPSPTKPPAGPYSIGSSHWPGLSKLIEECGEVMQVGGKLMGTGGKAEHWDGSNLRVRLVEELGDLSAAILFFATVNGLDLHDLEARSIRKLAQFDVWHAEQQGGNPDTVPR